VSPANSRRSGPAGPSPTPPGEFELVPARRLQFSRVLTNRRRGAASVLAAGYVTVSSRTCHNLARAESAVRGEVAAFAGRGTAGSWQVRALIAEEERRHAEGGVGPPTLPCPTLPYPALPCQALPCPAMPCPALPCHCLYPALPCPASYPACPALP
jgi:hypothetical protein